MKHISELPKQLTELDVPFKISAGPGAGKTTWLVKHVQNVIKNSNKLERTKKVACITYTRIGADTVNKKVKIETGTDRLDIGTIHNFLYRNVVKPFSFLIEKDIQGNELFNINELNGHVEHIPSYNRISSWIKEIGFKYSYLTKSVPDANGKTNLEKTVGTLSLCDWFFDESKLTYKPRKNYFNDLKLPTSKLYEYKISCWHKGIMHHEDILYFTYYIFENYPRIIEVISNKFPYLFLDEFQDTNPLQTWVVKKLASQGTIVGVIGDPAQSIFEFAGAKRTDFNNFDLPKLCQFKKSDNYRSTVKIIDFLKTLRNDIEQKPSKKAAVGESAIILVGSSTQAIEYVKNLKGDSFSVLCRYNKDVNKLRYTMNSIQGDNLISILYAEDGDYKRPRFIHSLFKAYDYYDNEEYKEAIKEIKKHLRTANIDGIEKRKLSIQILEFIKNKKDHSVIDVYSYLQNLLKEYSVKLTALRKSGGKYKDIYLKPFNDFLPFLSKQTKIKSEIRTIHQAKGDEFDNVLLCLFDKTDKTGKIKKRLENILNDYIFKAPENIKLDTVTGEETRLIYVACSRAMKNLIINIESISEEHRKLFEDKGCRILEV